jgi:hypothetical protein
MNSSYVSSIIIILSILILCLFIFNFSVKSKEIEYKENYIKINDNIITIPNYMLDSLLSKYRNRLINCSKENNNLDYYKLLDIEKSLSDYVYIKFNIKFSMNPLDIEKYILNQGIPSKGIYDDELVGGNELSEINICLGKIIWLLEQLIIMNKNNSNIDIPVDLQKIDTLLNHQLPKPRILESNPSDIMPINTVIEYDEPEQWRKPIKSTPSLCSNNLRNNLYSYISDSAANDIYDDDMSVSIKNKTHKDTINGWNLNSINQMTDTTHSQQNEFSESNNRFIKQQPAYKDHNLSLKLMKHDIDLNNEKKSLTNAWDYLENSFLAN